MIALKLRPHGDSTGVILPEEALARMKVTAGDTIYLTETPDGYRITPDDPHFAEQMTVARRIMKGRRDVLAQLAKS